MRKRILLSCLCLSLIAGSMTGALAEEIGTEQVPAVVSDGGSTELPIPETPPAAPTVQSVTCRQIVLNPVEGCEYALIPTGGDVTGPVIWQQSPVFADIQANTTYTVYQRIAATETHQVSAASAGLAVIPKHTERSTVAAPTCTQKGYTKHVCTVCGNSETDSETPALGHEYKNTVIAPTCMAKGYTKHTCERCGDSYSDGEKPALGHKMTKTAAKKATCTKAGNKEYWTCSRCKKVFRDAKGTQETTASKQKIKAIGHSYKTVTTKAKPGKNGRIRTTCKNCGRVKSSKTISRPSRIVLSRSSYAWDGSSHKPSVTVKNASGSTISSKNYRVSYPSNTRSAGKHTITVTFKGKKYSGRMTASYTIGAKSISGRKIHLSRHPYTYNGKVHHPTITISGLREGTDFTVSYSDTVNAGIATVRVTGKGNYTGSVSKTFTIRPRRSGIQKLTARPQGFYVRWKKVPAQISGYEIQYARKASFAKAEIVRVDASRRAAKILNLRGEKNYYVRVRTYKNVGKIRVYSKWSAVWQIKTKAAASA